MTSSLRVVDFQGFESSSSERFISIHGNIFLYLFFYNVRPPTSIQAPETQCSVCIQSHLAAQYGWRHSSRPSSVNLFHVKRPHALPLQRESYFQQVLETGTSLKVVSTETSSYLLFVSAINSQVRISANALIVRLPLLLDHVVSSGPERRAFSLPLIAGYSSEEEAKEDARVRWCLLFWTCPPPVLRVKLHPAGFGSGWPGRCWRKLSDRFQRSGGWPWWRNWFSGSW